MRRIVVFLVLILICAAANSAAEPARRASSSVMLFVLQPSGTLLAWLCSTLIVTVPISLVWADVLVRLSRSGVPEIMRTGSARRWVRRFALRQLCFAFAYVAACALVVVLVGWVRDVLLPGDLLRVAQWALTAGAQIALYLSLVPVVVVVISNGLMSLLVLLSGSLLFLSVPLPMWVPLGHTSFLEELGQWVAPISIAVSLVAVAMSTARFLGHASIMEKLGSRS